MKLRNSLLLVCVVLLEVVHTHPVQARPKAPNIFWMDGTELQVSENQRAFICADNSGIDSADGVTLQPLPQNERRNTIRIPRGFCVYVPEGKYTTALTPVTYYTADEEYRSPLLDYMLQGKSLSIGVVRQLTLEKVTPQIMSTGGAE